MTIIQYNAGGASVIETDEEWSQVPGCLAYMVSNLGRVRSATECIKATDADIKGYLRVKLWKNGRPKNIKVHRLVYQAFFGEIPEGMVVRHDNGINTDNRASNLLLGTYSDNEKDKVRHGTVPLGEAHHSSRLTEDQIRQIRARYKKCCSNNGAKALAVEYGVSAVAIGNIVHRKTWTHVL